MGGVRERDACYLVFAVLIRCLITGPPRAHTHPAVPRRLN